MSWWTKARDTVTGTVAPIVQTATGGLLGTLGGAAGAGGLMGLFGGGMMQPGAMSGFSQFGQPSPFGSQSFDQGQYGSLMDMLGQRYPQQGQVAPTGSITGQGLI